MFNLRYCGGHGQAIPLLYKVEKGGETPLPTVVLQPGESQEQLLKRFRKIVAKSGILSTVRRKRWHVSRSELRRIQKKKAIRRARRRMAKYNRE